MNDKDTRVASYLRRFEDLKKIRQPWEDEWKDIQDFIPGFDGWEEGRGSGDKRGPRKAYDGTATTLLNLMADGLFGKLIPSSVPWFKLRSANNILDAYRPFRVWIEACDRVVYKAIERSNFYDCTASSFYWGGGIGTTVILMEEDNKKHLVQFSLRHIKEIYLSRDRHGVHDTVYRLFEIQNRNLMEHFGDELGPQFAELAEKRPFELVKVLHVVEPNGRGAYRSVYILIDRSKEAGSRLIHEGRYQTFPYLVWTFRPDPIDPYGRSPTMDALYDIEMLNLQAKGMAEAGHLAIKPPLLAHESLRGQIRIRPEAITYYGRNPPMGGPLVQPLFQGVNYPIGLDQQERRTQILRQHYRSDIFSYLIADLATGEKRERTATEVSAIEAQASTLLSPITGRIQKTVCEPVISYIFQFEAAAGRIPPMPRELLMAIQRNPNLAYDPLEIEYTGPLAQGQKRYLMSQPILQGAAIAAQFGAIRPESLDIINWDGSTREAIEAQGFPTHLENDERIIKAIREQRAAQQAALFQTQLQGEQAKAYAASTKAPEPGSPFSQEGAA